MYYAKTSTIFVIIIIVQGLLPPNQALVQDLVISQEYQVTLDSCSVLMYDSGNGPDGILIFSTNKNFGGMSYHCDWFANGTFKTTPLLF